MKTCRRIFSLALALALVFPYLPGRLAAPMAVTASAALSDLTFNNGVYEIWDKNDFAVLAALPEDDTKDKTFRQMGNFTIAHKDRRRGFFRGTYDGNGYTITVDNSNFSMYNDAGAPAMPGTAAFDTNVRNASSVKNCAGGVFDCMSDTSTVKNLNVRLNSVSITGRGEKTNDVAGGIVGWCGGGTIENCGVTGDMRVTQRIENKYFTDLYQYANYTSVVSQMFAGGIAGEIFNGATVRGCYSGLNLYVGSASHQSFTIRITSGLIFPVYNAYPEYNLFAGGIAGWIYEGGTLESCLFESGKIYMGDAANNGVTTCNASTRAFAGGIAGHISGEDALKAPSFKYNVVRNYLVNAYMQSSNTSTGAALCGWITTKIYNNLKQEKNYMDVRTNAFGKSQRDYPFYVGDGWNASQYQWLDGNCYVNGNPTASDLGEKPGAEKYWVDGVRASGSGVNYGTALKWTAVSAPTVRESESTINDNGFNIVLVPSDELAPKTAPEQLKAEDIRFELTVANPGQLAMPSAALNGDRLTFSAAQGTVYYGTVSGDENQITTKYNESAITVPPGGGTYWIQARTTTGNLLNSGVRKVTVEAIPTSIEITPVGTPQQEASTQLGKLASPTVKVANNQLELTSTLPQGVSGTLYWGTDAANMVNTSSSILLTSLSAGGSAVYYAHTLSGTPSTYYSSNTIRITITKEEASYPEPTSSGGNAAAEPGTDPDKDPGQLASPSFDLKNGIITLTPPNSSSVDKIVWGETQNNLNQTGNTITLNIAAGASATYYVKTVSKNTAYKDSEILSITVTRNPDVIQDPVVESSNVVSSFEKGRLATPAVAYEYTDGIPYIVLSYTGPASTDTTVAFRYGTSSPPSNAYSAPFTVPDGTNMSYYVQSVDQSGKYIDSNPFELQITKVNAYLSMKQDPPVGENGSVGGEKKYTFADNIHSLPSDENIMVLTSDVPIVAGAGSTIELKVWMQIDADRVLEATYNLSVEGVSAKPYILPGLTGNLGDGLTFSSTQAGAVIYYTMTFDGTEPENPSISAATGGSIRYNNEPIPWDNPGDQNSLKSKFTGQTMWIKAVAKHPDYKVSGISEIKYTKNNKPRDKAPSMTVNGIAFQPGQYYNAGDLVRFYHDNSADGKIYFTTDGSDPGQTDNMGTEYTEPYSLSAGQSSENIKAVLVRDNYPNTLVCESTAKIRISHGAPLYSIENNALIPLRKTLTLMFNPEDLPAEIRPAYYIKEGDTATYRLQEVLDYPGEYYGVIEVNDNPNFSYDQYIGSISTVYYRVGSSQSRSYNPGTPEIRFLTGYVEDTSRRIEHKKAAEIILDGSAGNSVTVTSWLTPSKGSLAYDKGAEDSKSFTFYPPVAAPTAAPATSDDNLTVIDLKKPISLASKTIGAKIFYSTAGEPSVIYENGTYKADPGDPYTIDYDTKKLTGIEVSGIPEGYFTLFARAYKNDMSESESMRFSYKISALPVAASPTAAPKTEDGSPLTIQSGSLVTLQSATGGAQIFYSLNGTPEVDKSVTPYRAGKDTFLFDKSIAATGGAGEFFVIRAVTAKPDMTDSPVTTFTYQFPAPVQAVWASPAEGEVVKGTTVTLSTTTAGATIFYEVAYNKESPDAPVPNESPVFDPKKPIVIDKTTHITAMAVKDGVESIVTEYEYTVAKQVREPEPSIPSGSVVAKGTKVSFSTTSGASITYTKDGSDPADPENKKRMYGSEIAIDAEEGKSVSISLYATKSGMTPSEVVSVSYTVSKSDEVLTANPPAGSVVAPGDRITLSTSVTDAEIYYTTDGTTPTTSSKSGSTVTVEGAYDDFFVLRAIAATESSTTSPYTFSYPIVSRTPMPSASIPTGAVFYEGAEVVLTAPEGNIYYTTDGSDPTVSGQMYTVPVKLTGSTVLKAIATANNKAQSKIAEFIYTKAGQVAAPAAGMQSGAIEVGSQITLSSTTDGAVIYYTTNGGTPQADNLNSFVYESPITIMRPVTIKMFAVKDGMNASIVNTVTYTVFNPILDEEVPKDDIFPGQRDADKLFLFDQYVDSGEGPSYSDLVLRDSVSMTVLSAPEGVLPENARLAVERDKSPSTEDREAVRRALELELAALYDISILDQNGDTVQPANGGVEIGMLIPEGYEDAVIMICRINDNGTVTAFSTRRSGNMAYAVVDHFSKYAVAVPAAPDTKTPLFQVWYLWALAAAAGAAATAVLAVIIIKRRQKNKTKRWA